VTASEIWQYSLPYIEGLGPVIMMLAIIAFARGIVEFVTDIFYRYL